ncbi:MAG: ABC transporter permease [Clostridiales bacterium]|jgi:spermidine/putrescine transport system permease protein|nr:ABC transporter permease [Clostridiales bacterium]
MAVMRSAEGQRARMAAPYLLWAFIFIIVPIILIIYYSLTIETDSGPVFSWSNYARAFEPTYLSVMWRSVLLALICTIICVLAGYPVAYIMASKEYSSKGFLLFLFLVPMWMNFLLRTYSWIAILENNGVINTILKAIGLPALKLLYVDQAVVLGMVYNFLPFMILPIYTVLRKMDQNLIEAAQDLGADNRLVFINLILPLSMPGVISGVTMVFMPAVTTFIISSLLGGGQYMLIGNLIERQFLKVSDWHFGSAVSVIIIALVIVSTSVFSIADKDSEGGALF